MCGIAGILYSNPERGVEDDSLLQIRRALRHRGPDGEGSWSEGSCGLCHTRLSILDLSQRGQQPMVSANGRYVLSYNGEIYNFRELREELEGDGCLRRGCPRLFGRRSQFLAALAQGVGGFLDRECAFPCRCPQCCGFALDQITYLLQAGECNTCCPL